MKMKKNLFLFVFALMGSFAFGQGTLEQGELQANGGLGFSNWGVPVFAGIDYGLTDEITVGGEISFRSKTVASVKYTGLGFFANTNYHFNKLLELPSVFDVYAGVSLGYYNWSTSVDVTESKYNSGTTFTGQIGGRYFFNHQWAVNLELGIGSFTGGKLGVTYRF